MAGDWIPMRLDLCDDPAVLEMADLIDQPEEYVVGCLHKVWSWASRNCHDGTVTGVTILSLSRAVKLPTAVAAMAKVGWLTEGKGEDGRPFISFPKWENWLSKSAKARLQNSMNQRNARELKNSQASKEVKERHDSVTALSLSDRDKTVTTEQNSRVEYSNIDTLPEWLKKDWARWLDFQFAKTGQRMPETQADAVIMDLLRRGEAKALRDIEFSIRIGAKNICHDDGGQGLLKPGSGPAAGTQSGRKLTNAEKTLKLIEEMNNGNV
jgi:hypothetical protein